MFPQLTLPLYTERLILRDFTLADYDAVHAYSSDPLVTRYMFFGPRDAAESYDYLLSMQQSQQEKPRLVWEVAVVRQADNALIGGCDLTYTGNPQEADLGYILAQPAWGQGYATEIARALVQAGFSQLQLTRIVATCDVANSASAHVLEKAGLRRHTTLIQYKYAKGRWWDVYFYALERREWAAPARAGIARR